MSRFVRRLAVSALAISFIVVAASCKPKEGGKCTPGKDICLDPKTALHCDNNIYEKVACRGKMGCTKLGSKVSCDDTMAAAGDNCFDEGEDYACTVDGKQALICKAGKFTLYQECRGSKGCVVLGGMFGGPAKISCDATLQTKGDPCTKPGVFSCSADYKNMLICKDGKMEIYRYCRGQNGCQLKGSDYDCDLSLSEINDPCGIPGMIVCSSDGKNELVCRGGKFELSRACKKGCSLTAARRILCEG